MLLSMFLSFLLARKFSSRNYVRLVTILIIVVSLFSMGLPLSFPFYARLEVKGIMVPEARLYVLYFLTFEINRSVTSLFILEILRYSFLMLFLHYLFFLLVNIVGVIIRHWIGKSKILERLF